MGDMKHIPRFYIDCKLQSGSVVVLNELQAHHALNVLRLKTGDIIRVFNKNFGEWNCEIVNHKKRQLICRSIHREYFHEESEAILAFSLIAPNRLSILLEKITELGAAEIIPIVSQYTQHKRFHMEKARQTIVGASEQSGRMDVPKLHEAISLKNFLDNYCYNCPLMVGDEKMTGSARCDFGKCCAFLVGPEGGFSDEEMHMLEEYNFVKKVSFGDNILRSETAAIAFMSIWRGVCH
jgi:16S rRNA (uracil1498-N3)-methyltransferase